MKKTISVILAIATLMSLLCISSFAASVSLIAAPSKAKQGDTITVSANVPAGFGGAKLVLEYDTSSFELVSVTKGNNFLVTVNDKTPGKIIAPAVSADEQPACTVFSARFKVLKTGGKMSLKATDVVDGTGNDITASVSGASITIAADTGSIKDETTPPQKPTEPQIKVTKPAGQSGGNSGNKVTTKANKDKVEGVTGTAQAPAPDDTLPAEIMPDATTTTTVAAVETETAPVEKSNKKAIIIAVVATVLAAAAAVVIVLVIKKKKEQEAPENQN